MVAMTRERMDVLRKAADLVMDITRAFKLRDELDHLDFRSREEHIDEGAIFKAMIKTCKAAASKCDVTLSDSHEVDDDLNDDAASEANDAHSGPAASPARAPSRSARTPSRSAGAPAAGAARSASRSGPAPQSPRASGSGPAPSGSKVSGGSSASGDSRRGGMIGLDITVLHPDCDEVLGVVDDMLTNTANKCVVVTTYEDKYFDDLFIEGFMVPVRCEHTATALRNDINKADVLVVVGHNADTKDNRNWIVIDLTDIERETFEGNNHVYLRNIPDHAVLASKRNNAANMKVDDVLKWFGSKASERNRAKSKGFRMHGTSLLVNNKYATLTADLCKEE